MKNPTVVNKKSHKPRHPNHSLLKFAGGLSEKEANDMLAAIKSSKHPNAVKLTP